MSGGASDGGMSRALQTVAATGPSRVMIDCRKYSKVHHCSLTLNGTESEVLEAAMLHAVHSHGHPDTPDFRELLRNALEPAEPDEGLSAA